MTTLEHWLKEEPFTLALSSGFFGFYSHCGFVAALEDHGIRPAQITGASAGALIAGLWAAGMPATEIKEELLKLKREDFWDPAPGLGLLKGNLFRKKLQELLPTHTIESCPTKIKISAHNVLKHKTDVLEQGDLIEAIYASCAVPGLFHPSKINRTMYSDGGIKDKAATAGVDSEERCLSHYLDCRFSIRKHFTKIRKPSKESLGEHHENKVRAKTKVIHLSNLPKLGPFKMKEGRDAIDITYRKVSQLLKSIY